MPDEAPRDPSPLPAPGARPPLPLAERRRRVREFWIGVVLIAAVSGLLLLPSITGPHAGRRRQRPVPVPERGDRDPDPDPDLRGHAQLLEARRRAAPRDPRLAPEPQVRRRVRADRARDDLGPVHRLGVLHHAVDRQVVQRPGRPRARGERRGRRRPTTNRPAQNAMFYGARIAERIAAERPAARGRAGRARGARAGASSASTTSASSRSSAPTATSS